MGEKTNTGTHKHTYFMVFDVLQYDLYYTWSQTHAPPMLCFQVEGSKLQSALRHDSGRGHPVPPGHTETLQDYYEYE